MNESPFPTDSLKHAEPPLKWHGASSHGGFIVTQRVHLALGWQSFLLHWASCLVNCSPLRSSEHFPGGTSGKEPACQCRRCKRCRFNPWVGKIPLRRAWQPLPVFLPGESCGQRSLTGYRPWGRKESNTAALAHMQTDHQTPLWGRKACGWRVTASLSLCSVLVCVCSVVSLVLIHFLDFREALIWGV